MTDVEAHESFVCVAGVCTGCLFGHAVCKQKEPAINTMLRKEGLLNEYLKHQRPLDTEQIDELETPDPFAPRYEHFGRSR